MAAMGLKPSDRLSFDDDSLKNRAANIVENNDSKNSNEHQTHVFEDLLSPNSPNSQDFVSSLQAQHNKELPEHLKKYTVSNAPQEENRWVERKDCEKCKYVMLGVTQTCAILLAYYLTKNIKKQPKTLFRHFFQIYGYTGCLIISGVGIAAYNKKSIFDPEKMSKGGVAGVLLDELLVLEKYTNISAPRKSLETYIAVQKEVKENEEHLEQVKLLQEKTKQLKIIQTQDNIEANS